jgi:RNA polymerase sigma factor (sigma-70 family)
VHGELPIAVAHWSVQYGDRLIRTLIRQGVSVEVAQDAIQDVWLGVLRHPPPSGVVADPRRLWAWLLVATRRRAADLGRRERLRAHHALPDIAGAGRTPEQCIEGREDCELVSRALSQLSASGSPSAARLLELRFLNGMSLAGLSQLLAVSDRAVSARLQRATKKFRAALNTVEKINRG